MSFEITTAFVEQYKSTVDMLAQQMGSRLRSAVTVETGINGKRAYFEQLGSVRANKIQNRHGDSPLNPTPHARRAYSLWDYDVGDLIDKPDLIRTLIDPTNPYTRAHAAAMGRAQDEEILDAAFGTAYTGADGTTAVTSGWHTVAVNSWTYGTGTGNAGLTISKLIEAKVKLLGAEALDELTANEPLHIAVTAADIGALLATTEATSSDFNTVKALVKGEINDFMGFNFHRTELIRLNGSSYRRLPAWTQSGLRLGIGADAMARIAERSDKRFSTYVYSAMTIGAVRTEEVKVAEVICA